MTPRYQPADIVDILNTDQGLLVLTEHRLFDLGPLGAAVIAIPSPFDVAEARLALEGHFGPPPSGDATSATAALLAELVDQGVLHELPEST